MYIDEIKLKRDLELGLLPRNKLRVLEKLPPRYVEDDSCRLFLLDLQVELKSGKISTRVPASRRAIKSTLTTGLFYSSIVQSREHKDSKTLIFKACVIDARKIFTIEYLQGVIIDLFTPYKLNPEVEFVIHIHPR